MLGQGELGLTTATWERKAGRQLAAFSSLQVPGNLGPLFLCPWEEGPSLAVSALEIELGSGHSDPGQEKVPTLLCSCGKSHMSTVRAAMSHPVSQLHCFP